MNDLPVCTVDFETRSFVDVNNVGSWRYAEDVTTEIYFLSYKLGSNPTKLWTPGYPFPQEIIDHVAAGGMFEAHNVQFERAIWIMILRPQYGIAVPKSWRCTLAACAYRGLPLKLNKAGAALGLAIQKDDRGTYLLNTLCSPKFGTKKEPNRIYREDPDLVEDLGAYCVQDSDAEHALSEAIGPLPNAEYLIWCLDQRINQRGVLLDMEAVEAALKVITNVTDILNAEIHTITEGAVFKATQVGKLLEWFRSNGLPHMPNLQKGTLEELLLKDRYGSYLLKDKIPDGTLRALVIRSQLAKASVKKLEKMIDSVSQDDRVRGLLQYHGAGTGRWAGRLVQPQNFPRALFKACMDELIELIKQCDPAQLDAKYGSTMDAIATSLRGMFIAAPGKVFRICDFSAVEARVVFWVAECKDGLDVFHKSDRGECEDIYCITASDLVGFEVKKAEHGHERQLGKITVLGCGYQMGWEKLQTQAKKDYKIVLTDAEAQNMVDVYREKYEPVKKLWKGLENAAIATVQTGKPHLFGRIQFEIVNDNAGQWLVCVLPNNRRIWYYQPIVEKWETPWGKVKDSLTYMGRDNKKGGSWGRVRTYGGMLTENVVQAIARDLLAEAMIRVDVAGYNIVMTVHDEIISEDDPLFGSQEEFEALTAEVPSWAKGCPIAVEGGEVTRYQKI